MSRLMKRRLMLKKLQSKGFAKEAKRLTRSQVAKIIEDILEAGYERKPHVCYGLFY